MIGGVVLAAGYSSRMGGLKPALMIGQDTVIDLTVGNFVAAGITDTVVVTGYRAGDIGSALYFRDGVRFAHNAGFDAGMFTSVMPSLNENAWEPIFTTPSRTVYAPLLSRATINKVV